MTLSKLLKLLYLGVSYLKNEGNITHKSYAHQLYYALSREVFNGEESSVTEKSVVLGQQYPGRAEYLREPLLWSLERRMLGEETPLGFPQILCLSLF
jgi:hypothetical protein